MSKEIDGKPTYAAEPFRSDIEKATFLESPHLDNLTTALIAMGSELWSLRRRVLTTEALMEKHGSVTKEMIEQYEPSAEEKQAWEEARVEMVQRIYGVFAREADPARKLGASWTN